MARARFLDQVSIGPNTAGAGATNLIVEHTGSVVGTVNTLNFEGSAVTDITITGTTATIN